MTKLNERLLDSRSPALRCRAGFTIIELLAVVMIMAILGAIVIGIAGYAGRRGADASARADLQNLRSALTEYQLTRGSYPPADITTTNEWAIYAPDLTNQVEEISFEDPWGEAYQYRGKYAPGETGGRALSYELWSWGPTGEAEDYDIIR